MFFNLRCFLLLKLSKKSELSKIDKVLTELIVCDSRRRIDGPSLDCVEQDILIIHATACKNEPFRVLRDLEPEST